MQQLLEKKTAKQWFADKKLCILNTICSYLVQTIKKSFDTRLESLENSLNCNPLPGEVDVTQYRAQLLRETHKIQSKCVTVSSGK